MRVFQQLRLNRVDVVDKGANPGAHITLAKRAPTEERPMAEQDKDTLPEAVAKRLADAETANVELAKRLKDAEDNAKVHAETVAKMLEDNARAESVTVAKSFTHIGTDEAKLAEVLFVAKRKLTADEYGSLTVVLTAANAQVAKGALFATRGVDAQGEAGSELDKLVAKRMQDTKEAHGVALLAVLQTAEGKAAYNDVRGGTN